MPRITVESAMPPDEIGRLVADQFAGNASYVHIEGLPFVDMEEGKRGEYIRRVSSAIGELSLSSLDPISDVWRLDQVTSPSQQRIPYHSDNPFYTLPEHVIGFWNVKSSPQGGENILLPRKKILECADASPEMAELVEELQTTEVTFTHDGHEAVGPIIDGLSGIIRFDRRYIDEEHVLLAEKFSHLLEGELRDGLSIKLAEGDVLFFDNRTLLHARTSYTDVERLSFRVRVKELNDANSE